MNWKFPTGATLGRWVLMAILGWLPVRGGTLLREVFSNIPGVTLDALTNSPAYPNKPTSTNIITDFFEAPTDVAEDYGQRLRGIFTAPLSGKYTFWIAADDYAGLFLSTDAGPDKARWIAGVLGWTPPRQWDSLPEQKSAPITLVAGARYYIEALQKEGGGGDNLAVRWVRPDGVDEGPIPLDHFVAWGLKPEAPRISQQPVALTVDERGSATFTVAYDNPGGAEVFWKRSGTLIPNATGTSYTLDPVRWADHDASFQAFLTNALGSTQSVAVTLTVTPDTVAPEVRRVYNVGLTNVVIEFSEAVVIPAGAVSDSFRIDGGVSVQSAALGTNPTLLVLQVSGLVESTRYRLTINGIRDQSARANALISNTEREFFTTELFPVNLGGNDARATLVQWLPEVVLMFRPAVVTLVAQPTRPDLPHSR